MNRKQELLENLQSFGYRAFLDYYYNDDGECFETDLDFWKEKFNVNVPKLESYQQGDINNTSYLHKIYYFEDLDCYIKLDGWYSSYSGSNEWEDGEFSIVEPKEKTITVYE